MSDISLRAATAADLDPIRALVAGVALEVYGHLLPALPPLGDDWVRAILAVRAERIVGVALTGGDALDDLWIDRDERSRGTGSRLLAEAEREIAARGHGRAWLRLIAENHGARRFYRRHGWAEDREFRHERFGFDMIEMVKSLVVPATLPP